MNFLRQTLNSNRNFFSTFLHQLEIQSGVIQSTSEESGSHPDLLIRNCLKGLLLCLTLQKNGLLLQMLKSLAQEKKHIEATHLADLIARAIQYSFRKQDNATYLSFSSEQWEDYFCSLTPEEIEEIRNIVINKEVATHVLARYRALAALNFLYFQRAKTPLRIADIGCSLNFGLRAAVRGNILQKDLDTLTDNTSDQLILNSLKAKKPIFEYALGIDIQAPDFEWVASCAYFSKYEENRKTLKRYQDLILKDQYSGIPIHAMVCDISDSNTVLLIQKNHKKDFHIMYGSMVLYQLSRSMTEEALKNISQLLHDNGVFMELTFKNPHNWFLPWNTVTTLRFKENGSLSQAYQWLDWDSSRCNILQEGRDFQEVNLRLANIHITE